MVGLFVILFCLGIVTPNFGIEGVTALTCPPNEAVNKCANALCKVQDCKMKGLDAPCALVDKCVIGCLCIDGYLRAENSTCIPEDLCPPRQ